jgi:D-glycero-D-manno-heptose 1,7-bisphosphate phosphatase
MPSPAVFFDRDGTLIEDPGFLRDPDGVRLSPGAAEALCRLRRAGYSIIVVTNQSGIARGLFDEATLKAIHERMRRLFAEEGATIDAIYYCPYLDGPEAVVERYRRNSDLRKPASGMYTLAAREHDIDLAASWSIGDSARDTAAGKAAGCRTIQLVSDGASIRPGPPLSNGGEGLSSPAPHPSPSEGEEVAPDFRCHTLTEAADCILNHAGSPALLSPEIVAAREDSPSMGGVHPFAFAQDSLARQTGETPAPHWAAGEADAAQGASERSGGPRAPASGCESASSPLRGLSGLLSVEERGAASRSERLLAEIAEHVRVWARQRSMEDFTLAKLAGAVTELAAVGVAFWAFLSMASPQADVYPAHRWLAAIFLQLLALTFFVLHRQR